MSSNLIVIVVGGGVVQEVRTNIEPSPTVELIDYDDADETVEHRLECDARLAMHSDMKAVL